MTSPKAPLTIVTPAKVKEDFVYQVNGVEIQLPSLTYLKPGLVRRIRRLGDVDAMYTLLEMAVTPEALAALDDMDPDAYHEMLEAWRAHSGISLGES
ncbi:hypothetical protein [Nocardia huaxiensis]|uniref:Tail assembly chaperone E/41/14-like protein n=1 Tax=Nocardia huaxiensis TaxID=2755382 RepID=A0A7D6VAJ8_9NOCA|nr:hypothetical protein [Nocardia huaxiensis]QLY30834.1 hypothetical protein H0264_38130 [Nocardia huaxiensis]UFS94338.1 hypothetical protein LPY97_26715 [Nocardia huaxiensis]